MYKIKILVAQHKVANVFSNDVYTPIQVGKALSKVDLGIIGDNTGDNISELNPFFCELTAQYWAWKNIHDVEYIGLCHYRRYFKKEFTAENIEKVMNGADIILVKPVYSSINIYDNLSQQLVPEDITAFYLYLRKKLHNKKQIDDFYIRNNHYSPCNMFVCKKSIFDDFCKWQFDLLLNLFPLLPLSPYKRQQRLMGYLGETLLPFYCQAKGLKVKTMPIVSLIGDVKTLTSCSLLKRIKYNFRFHIHKSKRRYSERQDIITGLKDNGIYNKINEL